MADLRTLLSPISRKMKKHSSLYRKCHAGVYAIKDILINKDSYSQFGEDKDIYAFLQANAESIETGFI